MSYAQRPMGDYRTYGYAGDPGWLSSIWKGIKKVAPAIIGGIVGGPAGAILGGIGGGGGKPTPPIMAPTAFGGPPIPGSVGGAVTFPGGTRFSLAGVPKMPGGGAPGAAGGVCPSGWHYAKDGSGRLVRNRRMNVANPRALRRSMRRVQGFEKLAKRTIQFTRRVKMKK